MVNESYTEQEKQVIKNFNNYFESVLKIERQDMKTPYFNNSYQQQTRKFEKKKLLSNLKKDLDNVIMVLECYLKEVNKKANVTKKSSQLAGSKFNFVVNFNYTDTYKIYDIDEENVFYIHGKIKERDNNMVLGFAYEDENQSMIQNSDSIYFEKYFQRIQKKLGVLPEKKFYASENISAINKVATTIFFGHSMGISDGDVIKNIIEKLSDRIVIYYYDQVDYEEKVINLIKILGKEEVLELVGDKTILFIKIWDDETEDLLIKYKEEFKEDFRELIYSFEDEEKIKGVIHKCLSEGVPYRSVSHPDRSELE